MMRELVDGPAKTVWVRLGLPPDDLENLRLTEVPDPSVNSSFKLGTAAQVCTTYTFRDSRRPIWWCFSTAHHIRLPLLCKTLIIIPFFPDCRPQLDCLHWPQHTFISIGRVVRRKCTLMPDMPY
jgi:hypothetical protein